MDNQLNAREILESYEEIKIEKEISEVEFFITLLGKQFLLIMPTAKEKSTPVYVFLYNDSGLDLPHIMLQKFPFPQPKWPLGNYYWVCLYEGDDIVNSIVSYNEKICDAIDRLIKLLSLSAAEKTREYQKEFLLYWNNAVKDSTPYYIFLHDVDHFSKMNIFYRGNTARIVASGVNLSDIDSRDDKGNRYWIHHVENDVYYIPIIDSREIIPPHIGYSWTAKDISNIVYPCQIEHISKESFESLKLEIPKNRNIILVFGFVEQNIFCGVRISCIEGKGHSLFEKIVHDCMSVELLYTKRKDYTFMNQQIGNDLGLLGKKILLIGAGSLGSYVGSELVRNGVSKIRIYDGDKLEDENILRWACFGFGKNDNKAKVMALMLGTIHPEVKAEGIQNDIDINVLKEEASNADLIIFTIGSSDKQLEFNRALKEIKCSCPVIFAWLEAGGNYSHLLFVNYQESGCFECLYTNPDGSAVNNRAVKNPIEKAETHVIRNGCGGTRAAYGTATILRTTATLLNLVDKIMTSKITHSVLIDISPDTTQVSDIKFPEEACGCCGNTSIQ